MKNGVALGSSSVADRDALVMPSVATTATVAKNQIFGLDSSTIKDKTAIQNTVVGKLGAVSVGSDTATRQITHVAAGSEDSDAVNVAQLKAVANTPLGFTGDADTQLTRKLGENLHVKGGASGTLTDNNIGVVANGTDTLTVKLAEDIDLGTNGSVTTGNTVVNANGLTINNPADTTKTVSVTSGGINAGGNVISNVKAGDLSATSTEAVNGSQLYATNQNVTTAQNTADTALTEAQKGIKFGDGVSSNQYALGDTLNVKGSADGSITSTTTADGVQLGLGNIVTVGTSNPVSINGTTGTIGGLSNTSWDVNNIVSGQAATEDQLALVEAKVTDLDDLAVKYDSITKDQVTLGGAGSTTPVQVSNVKAGELSATSTDAVNGSQLYVTNQNVATNSNNITNLQNQTFKLQANGDTASAVKASDTVQFLNGDNINISRNGNDITVATAKEVAFDKVTVGNVVVDKTTNKITGIEAGTDTKDAVNKGQLDALATQQATADALNVKYDSTAKDKVTLGGAGSTTPVQVSNVKAGELSATSTDAVNGSQLYVTNQNVATNSNNITNLQNQTFKLQANGDTASAVKASDTVQFLNGDNINISRNGNDITVATAKEVAFDKVTVGNVVIDKATNKISGVEAGTDAKDVVNKGQLDNLADGAVQYERDPITNAINYDKVVLAGTPAVIGKDANGNNIVISGGTSLGNVANGVNASDAVNKGQLDSAQNALTNAGLSFAGDSGTNVKRKLGETLNITGGAKAPLTTGNIGVVANGKDGLLVQLAKDIDLGADGSVKTGNTVTNNEGVKVDDGKGNSTTITTAGTNVVDDEGNSADYTATGSELADKDGNTNISTAKGNTITNGDNVTTITGKGTNVVDNATGNSADYGANGFIATDVAGNTTIFNQGGVSFIDGTGMQTGPSISVGGLNAGGTVITNVGDAVKATDAVNKGQLDKVTAEANGKTDALGNSTANNLGGGAKYDSNTGKVSAPSYSLDNGSVNVNNVGDALTNLDDRIASNTDNIADLAAGKAGLVQQQTPTDSITVGAATGGTSVDFTGKDGDRVLTGVANGTVAAGSNDVVTGDQLNNTADSIVGVIGGNAKNEGGVITTTDIGGTGKNTIDDAIASLKDGENASNDNIQANTDRLDAGLSFGADNGADINKPIGDGTALKFEGSDNITTTTTGSGIKFDLSGNISVDSVTTGNTTVNNNGVSIKDGPSMTVDGIYAGNKTITGVADGIEVNDAVNLGQLNALDQRVSNSVNELGYKIGEVEDGANAGISAAMAMSSLPQAYIPGKSMIGGGVATYNGQSAVAVGISRVSDNGRWVIKANGTADTQGNAGGAIGAGFHF